MTAFRLLGLGVVLYCAVVVALEWRAYEKPERDTGRGVRLIANSPEMRLVVASVIQDKGQVEWDVLAETQFVRATSDTFYLRPNSSVAGEERYGLVDRDVTLALVGVNPVNSQLDAQEPLPPAAYEPDRTGSEHSEEVINVSGGIVSDSNNGSDSSGSDSSARRLGVTDRGYGIATYYHPSLHGGVMANGQVYNQWDPTTVAATNYPLGTTLLLTHGNRSIEVEVKDRGLIGPNHIDLSTGAFLVLTDTLRPGVLNITIEEVLN